MPLNCLLKGCFQVTLAIVILAGKVNSKFCNGGHICSPPKECCPLGCCLVYTSSGYRPLDSQNPKNSSSIFNLLLWNYWLFWILFALLLLFCICACGMWKKRQFFANRWWRDTRAIRNEEERSELDSTGSCYPPPQYSRCSSFHYAPPPYAEVTSKPDLYPLVISYRTDNGKLDDNCLVVQYFRNYVVHPALGSLSDGSTVDSFSSEFFNQSLHETDSSLPPTYEEFRIEERNLAELEPSTTRTTMSGLQKREKLFTTNNYERVLETSSAFQNDDIQEVVVENIHQSIQKASVIAPKLKTNSPTTLKNFKTLQNSARSLPSNLSSDFTAFKKHLGRPRNLCLNTSQRITKSVTAASCENSINGGDSYNAHQYSSDVILAQPQSYCDSNNELHYHSSDILNRLNHCLHNVNNSYSSEDNLSQPRGSLQDFVSSDGLSHSQLSNLEVNNFSTSSEVSSLQGCGSPDSPPRATSPTGEFRNLLDKIQLLPVHKDQFKFSELEVFDCSVSNYQVPDLPSTETNDNIDISETKLVEKSCILNESSQANFKLKKPSSTRPMVLIKENFPSRSKTFFMPFCHNSLKKNSNSKPSTSAPVTPVSNLPSPSSVAFSFVTNTNKFCSKKSIRNKGDSKPLLQDDEESHDEVF